MECEVKLIKSELLRDFAEFCLEGLPEYFFKVPASSSGKYHPSYTLGEGGLVRHTKAAVKIANDLLNLEQYQHLDRDLIIFALIFHDCLKKGYVERSETVPKHPLLAAEYIGDMYIEYGERILKSKVKDIMRLISSHMGQWDAGILPKPVEEDEKFVHLCDYLASRKYIICELEGEKGEQKSIYKTGKCDYCGDEGVLTRPSPFMADLGAMMCKICWDNTKEEYWNSEGTWIPEFEGGPGYGGGGI